MAKNSPQSDIGLSEGSDGICSEEEFVLILAQRVRPLIGLARGLGDLGSQAIGRGVVASLIDQARKVEDFLDDYDARYNQTFATLVELVASLKGFSHILYELLLLAGRFPSTGDEDYDGDYREETASFLDFVESSVRRLLREVCVEIESTHGASIDDVGGAKLADAEEHRRQRLPHDLGAEEFLDVERHVATSASLFQAAFQALEGHSSRRKWEDLEEMRKFVLEICDEQQCRFLETKIHNIQSHYDTFIKNTVTEVDDARLPWFRSCVSHSLHLLRMMTQLVHFYERHEDDIRWQGTQNRVANLIDKKIVLDRILNYGLLTLHTVMRAGLPVVEEILESYTTTESVTLPIPEGSVLHARPASLIAKVVMQHGVPVEMSMAGETCHAGSVMQVILLAANHSDARVVSFEGDKRPIADLRLLFECRLAESGMNSLPDELSYLVR